MIVNKKMSLKNIVKKYHTYKMITPKNDHSIKSDHS